MSNLDENLKKAVTYLTGELYVGVRHYVNKVFDVDIDEEARKIFNRGVWASCLDASKDSGYEFDYSDSDLESANEYYVTIEARKEGGDDYHQFVWFFDPNTVKLYKQDIYNYPKLTKMEVTRITTEEINPTDFCEHIWINADNDYVKNLDLCVLCNKVTPRI